MTAPITLLTDFGLADPYVGQMKGAILAHLPSATIIDLCHEILPHNITQASFLLLASYAHFPVETVFVCVIDPGVGSDRGVLLARHQHRLFLAPDNGLLSFLTARETQWWRLHTPDNLSNTFHGRDFFAPTAARLAAGAHPDSLGHAVNSMDVLNLPSVNATVSPDEIHAHVVHTDRFGNCLLNLPADMFAHIATCWRIGRHAVTKIRTYADLQPGAIGLLAGSQGVLELAMNQQSCASVLHLAPGSPVLLIRAKSTV